MNWLKPTDDEAEPAWLEQHTHPGPDFVEPITLRGALKALAALLIGLVMAAVWLIR